MYLIEGHKVTLLYLPFPLSSRCTLFLTILNSYRQVEKWKNCNKYKYRKIANIAKLKCRQNFM